MLCPGCNLENLASASFCSGCGAALGQICPRCAAPSSAQARFCGSCGATLGAPGEGERRHLSVMFCDLVDSTALGQRLDPEELHEIIHTYQTRLNPAIEAYEGHVAQYLGDGILVYFGYPTAHEDDAERSIRAGLAILDAMEALNRELEPRLGLRLSVRIGIHSGSVVTGATGGGREQLVFGSTVNLAARLQSIAPPGSLVISQDTLSLVRGLFVTEDLGPHAMKGFEEPVHVHKIEGASGVRSRLDAIPADELTPLVGRRDEMAELWARWQRAGSGAGQVVLISGTAGMGKSRLVRALQERIAEHAHSWLGCGCSPYRQSSALSPILGLLERRMGVRPNDGAELRIVALERALRDAGLAPRETLPLIGPQLGLALPEGYAPLDLGPELLRARTLDTLVRWLLAAAASAPLVLLVEDLHWSDPSTLELLGQLITAVASERVLVLLTSREESEPPWIGAAHFTSIALGRLSPDETAEMVAILAAQLPELLRGQVAAKTDGVPLFVEELTRTVLESSEALEGSSGDVPIPASLRDSLLARLDRLGGHKEVAQLAAVIGREFDHPLLAAVANALSGSIDAGLDALVDSGLVFRRGAPPDAHYVFKHALVQDAAYDTLLRSRRREIHGAVARVIQAKFESVAAAQPELLAHHYTEARAIPDAVDAWLRAARVAIQRLANREALAHLTAGLRLLEQLPEDADRDRRELQLEATRSAVLGVTQGFGAHEVGDALLHTKGLAEKLSDESLLLETLWRLTTFHHFRGEYPAARARCEEYLQKIDGSKLWNSGDFSTVNISLGFCYLNMGEFEPVLEIVARNRALEWAGGSAIPLGAVDREVAERSLECVALWPLGFPDQALDTALRGVEVALARSVAHPWSVGWAQNHACFVRLHRREWKETLALAAAQMALGAERGFGAWLTYGAFLSACARIGLGESAAVVESLPGMLAQYEAFGARHLVTFYLSFLAEAQAATGQAEQALGTIARAIETAKSQPEGYCEPELHRIEGEILRRFFPGREAAAQASFARAIAIARSRAARSWELRAATSMGRLLVSEGRHDAARSTLGGCYRTFTEGFETQDLRDAADLLAQLS